jgi:hypothetical protein
MQLGKRAVFEMYQKLSCKTQIFRLQMIQQVTTEWQNAKCGFAHQRPGQSVNISRDWRYTNRQHGWPHFGFELRIESPGVHAGGTVITGEHTCVDTLTVVTQQEWQSRAVAAVR